MKKTFLIIIPLLALAGYLLGVAIHYNQANPFKYEAKSGQLDEIKLVSISNEKVTFQQYGIVLFYLEGDSPSIGSVGERSYIFTDSHGTSCIRSQDAGKNMEEFTEPTSSCFNEAGENEAVNNLTWRWFYEAGKGSMSVIPIWSSK